MLDFSVDQLSVKTVGTRIQIENLRSEKESYSHAPKKLYGKHTKNGLLFKNQRPLLWLLRNELFIVL